MTDNKEMNLITTKLELVNLFHELGLNKSDDVIVHSSMKSLGFVVNGAIDVIDALIECVNLDEGTILMPAHTGQLTDPVHWKNPKIAKESIEIVRNSIKPFDKKLTPVRGRGIVAETLLSYPEVKRSSHPLNSFSAIGKGADFYTSSHSFDEPYGIDSPIGKLYQSNGGGTCVGIGVNVFTAIHLAEYIADVEYLYKENPVVLSKRENGINHFERIKKYPSTSNNFSKVLHILRDDNLIKEVQFKSGVMTHFKLKPVIDCIVKLLDEDPSYLLVENDKNECV
ncbi:AAC(3) family N-acetyltransferase [bacterium]|jgi:aminoglycoside 3-N-acetyltransferase|nr:AAC(3) family N-acetyltransferase [bacterium]